MFLIPRQSTHQPKLPRRHHRPITTRHPIADPLDPNGALPPRDSQEPFTWTSSNMNLWWKDTGSIYLDLLKLWIWLSAAFSMQQVMLLQKRGDVRLSSRRWWISGFRQSDLTNLDIVWASYHAQFSLLSIFFRNLNHQLTTWVHECTTAITCENHVSHLHWPHQDHHPNPGIAHWGPVWCHDPCGKSLFFCRLLETWCDDWAT